MNEQMDPGIWQAILNALRGFGGGGSVEQRAAPAQMAAQQIAQRMPDALMPNEALEEQKRRQALMDAILRGGQ